jgi:probable phosphoglycerate mutase
VSHVVLFVRHAQRELPDRLVGWKPGVHLTEEGRRQAKALGERLAPVPLVACVSSPLERCVETAEAILEGRKRPALEIDEAVGEARLGSWEGRPLAWASKRKEWMSVQAVPSLARFPGGESLREMQQRALDAVERIRLRTPRGVIAIVSHEDPIKALVASYLGLHLDLFQRIAIAPASVTAVALGRFAPRLLRLSDTGNYESLVPKPRPKPKPARSGR